ncbi:MAG: hypothetical protein OXM58_12960 [Rhodospirillaceae bacterium]|nr:hypothetical protein [Rhodospirillaceae bacterium]MDE0619021.1 hypothetical protein [Rhodospirillaceae bacterium]
MILRQPIELVFDQRRADPLLGEVVREIFVPREEVAPMAGKIVQPVAPFGGDLCPENVKTMGAAAEFVQGAGKMRAACIADRGIERVSETILHDPAAPETLVPAAAAARFL